MCRISSDISGISTTVNVVWNSENHFTENKIDNFMHEES